EHFGLVRRTGDGEVIRKYAMPDAEHVRKAATYFDKYAMDLRPQDRHPFAAAVKRRARDLGVALPRLGGLEKWASDSWNPRVQAHLAQRRSLLPEDARARDVLTKLAE